MIHTLPMKSNEVLKTMWQIGLIASMTFVHSLGCAGSREAANRSPLNMVALDATKSCWIEHWYCCGSFPLCGSETLRSKWASKGDERKKSKLQNSLLAERYPTDSGMAQWTLASLVDTVMPSMDPDTQQIQNRSVRMIDLLKLYSPHTVDRCAYALAIVKSPARQDRLMEIGSDDGIRVWLNGTLIDSIDGERPLVPNNDIAIGRFREGTNVLLVEVTNRRGYWGFALRICAPRESSPSTVFGVSIE